MSTALMKIEKDFPVLYDQKQALAALTENLGGESFDAFDLERVKVPSGGGIAWELDGEDPTKELSGIWVYHRLVRAYWQTKYGEDGTSNPPDCFSQDSITGWGDRGMGEEDTKTAHDCPSCPLSQFGSDGRAQACKQMRQVFFLRPGNILPTVLVVPPSSLKAAKRYLFGLANKGIPYWSVTTRLKLEKDKNQDGITYGRILFETGQRLQGEELERVRAYAESMKPKLQTIQIDQTETTAEAA